MKQKIISVVFLSASIPIYTLIVIMYIYMYALYSLIVLGMKLWKVDDIDEWVQSVDRFFGKITKRMF